MTNPKENAIRSEITSAIVNSKVNVCPFTVRLAWHASGTYDKDAKGDTPAGGSDGATMRFEPEISDGANAGLGMMQNILRPVKERFPELSYADLWTLGGCQAIKLMGGPDIPFEFGRTDDADGANCPMHGRLPDAALGAEHLREVFYRMGFNDQDIVALSGAHTVGSCHERRSGFDGPWTSNPIKFDNEYFRNLIEIEWTQREWEGPIQYQDPSGKLMMLPTDIALIKDEKFLPFVKTYAKYQDEFFKDFATAFAKLISLGCPNLEKKSTDAAEGEESEATKSFREFAMHGNLIRMKEIEGEPDPNAPEKFTKRTPLHKAAYFGHNHVVDYVLSLGGDPSLVDVDGDTPLHDAARLGHTETAKLLIEAGAKSNVKNRKGETPMDLATKLDCKNCANTMKKGGRCI
mmetsp:Transcript_22361/g.33469  ORF Transcript_22361/g.33469 Transcript_22361/m.33469 type:complete len:405 (+) Transcript_22361:99-1313(+)